MASSTLTSSGEKLFIVGLNAMANQAYYEERKGSIVKIAPAIYLDATLPPVDRRELLVKNAARIAQRLYPQAMLAGSSAFHRGPVDGHLMIATSRGGKPVDVGGAFKIYNMRSNLDLGMNNEVERVTIEDSFGPYTIKRISDEMLIIQNFLAKPGRPRQTYLNNVDLNRVTERCMRSLGGRAALMRRIESLAIVHGMAPYLKRINVFVANAGSYEQEARPLESYQVYWHQEHVGTLAHDGHVWNFDYEPSVRLQLSMQEKRGKGAPPSFLASLLPEVGIKNGTSMEQKLGEFRRARRYISNITVKSADALEKPIITDTLDGELNDFTNKFLEFTGRPDTGLRAALNDDDLLDSLHRDPELPRMSGMQIKLPGYLDRQGVIHSAKGNAFTHIIKVVGSNATYSSMCSMEWFSLVVAKACGLRTENFAIADLGGFGPSLIAERFDIRRDLNDRRMILAEDFWSVAGMTDDRQKYAGELMDVADAILRGSTDKDADGRHLLAQTIFSWLTFNGDMHLKNLLLLKETRDPGRGFESVRLSPAYDIMCTQVYPDDAKSAAISLAGSRNHTLAGFRALGAKFGIKAQEVDATITHFAISIRTWAKAVAGNLPTPIRNHDLSVKHINRACELFDVRCLMLFAEVEAAKQSRGRKRLAEAVTSFSGEVDDGALEHIQAERRRSGSRP